MGEGEPDVGPNTLNDNPMTIEGEVMWPPLFLTDGFGFFWSIWFLWLIQ